MLRFMLAAVALGIMVASVAAQSDPASERAKLMREQGKAFASLNRMVRGRVPYNQAQVDAAFVTLAETSRKLPALYPETAKDPAPDANYVASPKVWENKADFDALLAKLTKAIDENAPKVKNVDTLKQARAAIGAVCGDCHETYRLRKF